MTTAKETNKALKALLCDFLEEYRHIDSLDSFASVCFIYKDRADDIIWDEQIRLEHLPEDDNRREKLEALSNLNRSLKRLLTTQAACDGMISRAYIEALGRDIDSAIS